MINYNGGDIFLQEATQKNLLITDGTVTVSGDNYTVTGATVTITNDLLESEAFELKQSLCSQTQIQFGSCEAAQISFTIHENIPTIKGKVLKVYLIPNHEASKILQIGVFRVAEDKLSADRTKRTITAYDAMYDILNSDVASWYNTLLPNSSSSCTLAQFRASFLSYFGITAESTTLVNDSITIKRTIEPEQLSGADVIKAICEINGCFGTITNEGKFRFLVLSPGLDDGLFPSDTLYPADDLYPQDVNPNVDIIPRSGYIDVQFEDYNSESITQLTIRTTDDDVGVTVGTSGNRYIITGNFLVYGFNATQLTNAANNILGNMVNRYYRPCTVNAIGNPLHEVGDGIRVRTQYRGIVAYILERKMSGIQALRDTYSAQGTQTLDGQLNSYGTQYKQLVNKTLKLKADIDGVSAELTEQLDGTVYGSYAYITAQKIGTKVSETDYTGNEIASRINQTATTIQIEASKINLVGATTINDGFVVDTDGYVTMKNAEADGLTVQEGLTVSFGGDVQIGDGVVYDASDNELTMWDGGMYVDSNGYLNIDGDSSGYFSNVALNGTNIHIGYANGVQGNCDTRIYNCSRLFYGTDSNDAYIGLNSTDIGLHGDVIIHDTFEGKRVSWQQLDNVGQNDYVLVGS